MGIFVLNSFCNNYVRFEDEILKTVAFTQCIMRAVRNLGRRKRFMDLVLKHGANVKQQGEGNISKQEGVSYSSAGFQV